MQASLEPIPNSVLFQPPGTPLSEAQRKLVQDRVVNELQAMADANGFDLQRRGDTQLWRAEREGVSLPWLGDLVEAGLKRAAACLNADLVGGANVTRLDRTITLGHPRLPYRKAVRVANGRGWSLALGEEIPGAAQATLIRFCGLLPVQVMYLPGQPHPQTVTPGAQGLSYLLPLAGEALRAEIRQVGPRQLAICCLDLDRLLQFFLGLGGPDRGGCPQALAQA